MLIVIPSSKISCAMTVRLQVINLQRISFTWGVGFLDRMFSPNFRFKALNTDPSFDRL